MKKFIFTGAACFEQKYFSTIQERQPTSCYFKMAYSKLTELQGTIGCNMERQYQCPFVPAHLVRVQRFGRHLSKCYRGLLQRGHDPYALKSLMMEPCPFNKLHYVMSSEIEEHKKMCNDRPDKPPSSPKSSVKKEKKKQVTKQQRPEIRTQDETFGANREMWDDEQPVSSYDPIANVNSKPQLLYIPSALLTPDQKKLHRQRRRLQLEDQEPLV